MLLAVDRNRALTAPSLLARPLSVLRLSAEITVYRAFPMVIRLVSRSSVGLRQVAVRSCP